MEPEDLGIKSPEGKKIDRIDRQTWPSVQKTIKEESTDFQMIIRAESNRKHNIGPRLVCGSIVLDHKALQTEFDNLIERMGKRSPPVKRGYITTNSRNHQTRWFVEFDEQNISEAVEVFSTLLSEMARISYKDDNWKEMKIKDQDQKDQELVEQAMEELIQELGWEET